MSDLAQTWRRRRAQMEQREASLVALGMSKPDAHRHVLDEIGRAANRARDAGAKLSEIGRALGVGKEMARNHANRGARRNPLNLLTPLERWLHPLGAIKRPSVRP